MTFPVKEDVLETAKVPALTAPAVDKLPASTLPVKEDAPATERLPPTAAGTAWLPITTLPLA